MADDSHRDMPENTKLENIYRVENKLLRRQYRMHKSEFHDPFEEARKHLKCAFGMVEMQRNNRKWYRKGAPLHMQI